MFSRVLVFRVEGLGSGLRLKACVSKGLGFRVEGSGLGLGL